MDLPFFLPASAGFPSPGAEWQESRLNITDLLLPHPASIFYVRCAGNSMLHVGIHDGDILVVDRALSPAHNDVVIAALGDGGLTVKRLHISPKGLRLVAEHPGYPPLDLALLPGAEIWGVVTFCVHPLTTSVIYPLIKRTL
jgi:DNA polymerase V